MDTEITLLDMFARKMVTVMALVITSVLGTIERVLPRQRRDRH